MVAAGLGAVRLDAGEGLFFDRHVGAQAGLRGYVGFQTGYRSLTCWFAVVVVVWLAASGACGNTDAASDVRPFARVDGAAGTLGCVEGRGSCWCCARRWQCYGGRTRGRGWTGLIGRCWVAWPGCSPDRYGRAGWSRRTRCFACMRLLPRGRRRHLAPPVRVPRHRDRHPPCPCPRHHPVP